VAGAVGVRRTAPGGVHLVGAATGSARELGDCQANLSRCMNKALGDVVVLPKGKNYRLL
jgi:hypothetical protein